MERKFQLLLLIVSLSFVFAADLNETSKSKSATTGAQVSEQSGVNNSSTSSDHQDTIRSKDSSAEYLMTLEVRRQYVNEGLDQVLSSPVSCMAIVDDPVAWSALEELNNKREKASTVRKYITDPNVQSYGMVSPEREMAIQEATIGHICFDYPNKSTILALGEIKDHYPCTEAAAYALIELSSLVSELDYLGFVTIDGKKKGSLDQEYLRVNQYLIDNYPGTWQAEVAHVRSCILKYPSKSIEMADCELQCLNFFEENEPYDSKSYRFLHHFGSPRVLKKDYLTLSYRTIGNIYMDLCEQSALRGLEENGAIPQDSIEYYNNYFDIMERFKQKHPEIYEGFRERYERSTSRGFHYQTCISVVEEHRPDVIRESDLPKPKLKEKK